MFILLFSSSLIHMKIMSVFFSIYIIGAHPRTSALLKILKSSDRSLSALTSKHSIVRWPIRKCFGNIFNFVSGAGFSSLNPEISLQELLIIYAWQMVNFWNFYPRFLCYFTHFSRLLEWIFDNNHMLHTPGWFRF